VKKIPKIMNNNYVLPGINGSGKKEIRELELARSLLLKYLDLKIKGRTNTGNRTALMVSSTNGRGKPDFRHHLSHEMAAYSYKDLIGKNAIIFNASSSNDLREVIQDRDFAHIFLIGHANYHSWLASDKPVDWFDLGKMVNGHLKNGIFANVGCGGITSWNNIPLGYFVVNDHSNLVGYEAEYATSDKLGDISQLSILRRKPRLSDFL
jgi:hypothetical protein